MRNSKLVQEVKTGLTTLVQYQRNAKDNKADWCGLQISTEYYVQRETDIENIKKCLSMIQSWAQERKRAGSMMDSQAHSTSVQQLMESMPDIAISEGEKQAVQRNYVTLQEEQPIVVTAETQ